MAKAKVIGFKKVDFKADNGDSISGTTIFLGLTKDGVFGYDARKYFLKAEKFEPIIKPFGNEPSKLVGREVNVEFNEYGKPENISLVG